MSGRVAYSLPDGRTVVIDPGEVAHYEDVAPDTGERPPSSKITLKSGKEVFLPGVSATTLLQRL